MLVDLGCGDSADAAFANAKYGMAAYGVDLFPPSNPDIPPPNTARFTFLISDMVDCIPLKPTSVDYALCSAVIDLMRPEERLLFYRNVFECLKPGGVFLFTLQKLKRGWGVRSPEESIRIRTADFALIEQNGS